MSQPNNLTPKDITAIAGEVVRLLAMTAITIEAVRQVVREEIQSTLGVNTTDNAKLAALPRSMVREEMQAVIRGLIPESVADLAPEIVTRGGGQVITREDEQRFRLIIREEIRAALGTDETDVMKLAALPLAEQKAFAKAMMQRKREQAKGAKGQS